MPNLKLKLKYPMKRTIAAFVLMAIAIAPSWAIANKNTPDVKVDAARKAEASQWIQNNRSMRFLENKGQMADMQGKAVKNLLYRVSSAGVDMYVTTNGLSYVFTSIEQKAAAKNVERKMHDFLPMRPFNMNARKWMLPSFVNAKSKIRLKPLCFIRSGSKLIPAWPKKEQSQIPQF